MEQKPQKEKELNKALEIRDKILAAEDAWTKRQHKINSEIEGKKSRPKYYFVTFSFNFLFFFGLSLESGGKELNSGVGRTDVQDPSGVPDPDPEAPGRAQCHCQKPEGGAAGAPRRVQGLFHLINFDF